MKSVFLYILIMTVLASMVSAYVPWFVGTSTSNSPNPLFSSFPYDCIKLPWFLVQPVNDFNPFLGSNLTANLDPADPNNAQIIALNGGSPFIGAPEFCTTNGEVVEYACGDAYFPAVPANAVAAVQWSPTDLVTYFGAASSTGWACVSSPNGAFYAPQPGIGTYSTTGAPNFNVGFISAGQVYGTVTSPAGMNVVYVVGPLPSTSMVASNLACGGATYCNLPSTPVTCPGTYQFIGVTNAGNAGAASVQC